MTVKEQQLNAKQSTNARSHVQNELPVQQELLEQLQQLNKTQLIWLSGYSFGLSEASLCQSMNQRAIEADGFAEIPLESKVLVLYASQTGNAQSIAESLNNNLQQNNYSSELASTLEIKLKQLTEYQYIFVVASTHGEGEPPDDAIDFHESLHSKKAPQLDQVHFAVLGLGDSSYEFFCQTAKDFDKRFEELGAKRLMDCVECDIDYEQAACQWVEHIAEIIPTATVVESAEALASLVYPKSFLAAYNKFNPYNANIELQQKLTARGSTKNTFHVEIDISDSGLIYQPGDALAIIAENNSVLVDEVLNQLGFDATEEVEYEGQLQSIKSLLTHKLEITLLNKPLVDYLLSVATTSELEEEVSKGYSEFIQYNQLIDALILSQATFDVKQLVALLKPLKARLYSIASSQDEYPNEVHITLNQHVANNPRNKRYGLASHYLTESLTEGDSVKIYIEENNNFRLPSDDKPLIMIGPGTGVAPFRAFLQQRDYNQAKGRNWLFFGNPHFNTDFLYQTEFQSYVKKGLLTEIDVAFSRDQQEKIYVQDRLIEKSKEIWNWLEQGAFVFVCGDKDNMAKDVELALLSIIEQQGQKTQTEAKEYLKNLKIQSRYQRDVY